MSEESEWGLTITHTEQLPSQDGGRNGQLSGMEVIESRKGNLERGRLELEEHGIPRQRGRHD